MAKVYMVAGLGFGDEGKGTITEYLTSRSKAHTVIRYNGGAQAAHNVVRPDGTHHTFSQFGSGTFEGAATHLSRFVVIDPMALIAEGTALQSAGVPDVFDRLTVEDQALLITPYHKAANRLRELGRQSKHGSCGVGVGETVADDLSHHDESPVAGDLRNRRVLKDKLSAIRSRKLAMFSKIDIYTDSHNTLLKPAFDLLTVPVEKVVDLWMENASRIKAVSDDYLLDVIMSRDGAVVFEGAQGVLLDETWGFHPYTTWTDITFSNARKLLGPVESEHSYRTYGVIRTYHTRHGSGPFPSMIRSKEEHDRLALTVEKHNGKHDWQGSFRVGYFDMVLFRYALSVIKDLDFVALTHMDILPTLSKMCISYGEHNGIVGLHLTSDGRLRKKEVTDLEHQERLGNALSHAGLDLNYWPVNGDFIEVLQDMAEVKVGITSSGPTLNDKITL